MGTTAKRFLSILGFLAISANTAIVVHAGEVPAFPSCLVPQGEMKVSYENGIHGIVGDFGVYTGKDSVYNVTDDTVLQCFCPPGGQGIQTNWWKVGEMSYRKIDKYKKEGFVYVPTGSAYGLKNKAYLAKNIPFTCMGQPSAPAAAPAENQGGPGSSSSAPGPGSSASSSSGGVSSSSGPSGVAALAPTGTLMSIFNSALIGLLFVTGGLLVKKGSRS